MCRAEVKGYEQQPGFAYSVPHAGPFGGTGTYLVPGGEEPPLEALRAGSTRRVPWLSCLKLLPCGCRLRNDWTIYCRGPEGPVFKIEGEEFIPPL